MYVTWMVERKDNRERKRRKRNKQEAGKKGEDRGGEYKQDEKDKDYDTFHPMTRMTSGSSRGMRKVVLL